MEGGSINLRNNEQREDVGGDKLAKDEILEK